MSGSAERPSFREAFRFWLKLGFINFGGPTGQIALMHAELVERRRWVSEGKFLHALNFCMLLPGPEAQQLAAYTGWLLHGVRGGLAAGLLFILPGAVVLWALAWLYVAHGDVAWVAAAFYGLKPAVMAIVAAAMIRIGRNVLKNAVMWGVAAAAFVSIFFLNAPFPAIVFAAAALGFLGGKFVPTLFPAASHGGKEDGPASGSAAAEKTSLARLAKTISIWLFVWLAPLFAVGAWRGWDSTLFKQGVFFSKAAMVTFGGAYAVLPYVAQQAVERHGWLTAPQMMDGLGLAETTPGPLIMVVQFVGFLGAWQNPEGLSPLLAATLGALITTWVTFAPCFLWIFAGAPYIERLRGDARLARALSTVTAAVVGVMLNLAVWFGVHTLFPAVGALDLFALALAALAFLALVRLRWGLLAVIAACAACGWGWKVAGF